MAKSDPSRHAPDEVDAYLATVPDEARSVLQQLRAQVHEIAPGCTERVSYGIPIFRLKKDLVGMSARATRCSLHVMSPHLVEAMSEDLRGVKVSGSTVHFTPESPLPRELIEKIVRARMKEIGGS